MNERRKSPFIDAGPAGSEATTKIGLVPLNPEIVELRPELPTVPDAFRSSEYEGWLTEAVKRFQLRTYQKTQAERLAVLKQINAIQGQCLELLRNESNWRHFRQEDRIRQKRLDLEEMELDQRTEDFQYESQRRFLERQGAERSTPPGRPLSLVDKIISELEQAIRTEAGVKEVFEKARQEHPHLRAWLDEWEEKICWDLRERKWF